VQALAKASNKNVYGADPSVGSAVPIAALIAAGSARVSSGINRSNARCWHRTFSEEARRPVAPM
jgi:hypothetical protein